jgi:amino acid transporter
VRSTELRKLLALPVFSADPLSSVAYATEQAMIGLFVVSIPGRDLILPMSAVIAGLLVIVVVSYRQTVRAYTTSGGAYAVAKDYLGTTLGLTAAAALMIDYVLKVAVSISAGVTAITSAYALLSPLAVPMAVGFVALLTANNLRGVREVGAAKSSRSSSRSSPGRRSASAARPAVNVRGVSRMRRPLAASTPNAPVPLPQHTTRPQRSSHAS